MEKLQTIKRKIDSAHDLRSVVKTMKSLAAVNVHHYHRAAETIDEYVNTLDLALRITLGKMKELRHNRPREDSQTRLGMVIFGSELGMCGQFNDRITGFAVDWLDESEFSREEVLIGTAGTRVLHHLQNEGYAVDAALDMTSSITKIPELVNRIEELVHRWRFEEEVDRIDLLFNAASGKGTYSPGRSILFPIDSGRLEKLQDEPWPGKTLPFITVSPARLFSDLIRQYLSIEIYRAVILSLESENAGRLASMQAAEQNIQDHLDDLQDLYNSQRQSEITSELLDIISGYETALEQ